MINIPRKLPQICLYWETGSPDEFGAVTYETPVELNCRWEDTVELYTDNTGKTKPSSAIIYVDTDLELTGWLWLGTIDEIGSDSSDYEDPRLVEHAYEIKKIDKIPALHADVFLRKVYL